MDREQIDITLPQQAYAIFESLNYNPWNAIGEFIDNSIQSYLDNKTSLKKINKEYRLRISINLSQDRLEILDNAGGIDKESLKRGLKPATKPKMSEGLSEFGMGLKTASFWLSRKWSIITKHFNSNEEYTVNFDNVKIYTEGIEKISMYPNKKEGNSHYTKIILSPIVIDGSSKKIEEELKENLSSMYRYYLRNNEIDIYFNQEKLTFKKYDVLRAEKTYGDNKEILWEKEIDFILSSGKRITGYAGLLNTGNPVKAGFTYFRRNRVIEGLIEGVKIIEVLGTGNTKRSQRVFAELFLDSFRVSHTKDKIIFGNEIFEFKDKLRESLEEGDIKLLTQAEKFLYKNKPREKEVKEDKQDDTEATGPKNISSQKNPLEVNLDFDDDSQAVVEGTINAFAEDMKKSYGDMYKIENIIRFLIRNVESLEKVSFLSEDHYSEFEDKKIIRKINDSIKGIKSKEINEGLVSIRGKHDIYYTNFNVLKKIIELNYDKYFSKYFANKEITLGSLEHLYTYRNNIAHNSYLNENERSYINGQLDIFIRQLSSKIDFNSR